MVDPEGWGPEGCGPEGWEPKISRFFPSPAPIFSLFVSLWVSSRGILVFLKRRGPSNVHVWVLGVSCEAPARNFGRSGGVLSGEHGPAEGGRGRAPKSCENLEHTPHRHTPPTHHTTTQHKTTHNTHHHTPFWLKGRDGVNVSLISLLQFIAGRRHFFRYAEAVPHGPDYSADHRVSTVVRIWWSMSLFSGRAVLRCCLFEDS